MIDIHDTHIMEERSFGNEQDCRKCNACTCHTPNMLARECGLSR